MISLLWYWNIIENWNKQIDMSDWPLTSIKLRIKTKKIRQVKALRLKWNILIDLLTYTSKFCLCKTNADTRPTASLRTRSLSLAHTAYTALFRARSAAFACLVHDITNSFACICAKREGYGVSSTVGVVAAVRWSWDCKCRNDASTAWAKVSWKPKTILIRFKGGNHFQHACHH